MAICGCGLPACCCQPAIAGGIIYTDLRGELSTHLASQALFTQSSPVCEPLLQAFPFPSTLEEVTLTHFLRPACLFTAPVGSGSSPLSCGVFLPPLLLQTFLLLLTGWCCCSCQQPCLFTVHVGSGSSPLSCGVFLPLPLSQAFPLLPEALLPAWLVYLQFQEGFTSPNLWHSVHPTLFPMCLYCSYCLLVSLFSRVEVSLSRGLCCSGPGLSVGVLLYWEPHLVHVFPSHLGTGDWQPGGPPCFSI
jgi:hypothetical protein